MWERVSVGAELDKLEDKISESVTKLEEKMIKLATDSKRKTRRKYKIP